MSHNDFVNRSIKSTVAYHPLRPFLLNLLLILLSLHTEHLGVKKEAIQSGSDPESVAWSWMAQSVV